MLITVDPHAKRMVNLLKAVRTLGALLPGDKISLPGEKPATYLGAIEVGDTQQDYLQVHTFKLHDGLQVLLEIPSLNRTLGKLLY